MKKEVLEDALSSALSLLNNEVESVDFDDLRDEYLEVIGKIETALKELNDNG